MRGRKGSDKFCQQSCQKNVNYDGIQKPAFLSAKSKRLYLLELIEIKGGLLKSGDCLAISDLQTIIFFKTTIKTFYSSS